MPDSGATDSATTDSNASDVLAPDTTPIVGLTPGAWTWVPFPQALCRDGSSTGIGVNPGTSDHLMIFLEGGGACFNSATCGGNPSSFGKATFDSRVASTADEVSVNTGILDRTNAANPVRDWSFVYVPYCTGDLHAGNNVTTIVGVSGPPQHFVGYTNVGLYLDRLVPTFPAATQVLVAGLSAGGFGAALNYARVAQAFGAKPVTLLDDSGPFMEDPYFAICLQSNLRALWDLDGTVLRDCGGDCTTDGSLFLDVAKHITKAYPEVGMGLADSTDDSTISLFFGWSANACNSTIPLTGATFTAGLLDIRAQLASQPNFGEFIFAGADHTTIQSAAFYTRSSWNQAAGSEAGGPLVTGTLMTDWVAGLLGGAATNIGPDCTPKTCADFPAATCEAQNDTCGGLTALCGANDAGGLCPAGQFCGGGGPNLCGDGGNTTCPVIEVPLQCPYSFPPGTCGMQSDGFGSLTDCWPCPAPLTCGVDGVCAWPADAGPCVPLTCQSLGYECGKITDGCGNVLDCGTCDVSQFCGGGGPHQCGGTCTSQDAGPCEGPTITCTSDAGGCTDSCPPPDAGCGLVPGRCGGLLDCGPCGVEAGAPDAPAD